MKFDLGKLLKWLAMTKMAIASRVRCIAAKPLTRDAATMCAAAITMLALSGAASAACLISPYAGGVVAVSIRFPSPINIGGNVAVGQVVAQQNIQLVSAVRHSADCHGFNGHFFYQSSMPLASGFSNVYASGIPGLGLRFTFKSAGSPSEVVTVPATINAPAVGYVFYAEDRLLVEVVKTSSITGSGAVTPGQYASVSADDGVLVNASIPADGIQIATVTCQTPDVAVNLGQHKNTEMSGIGTSTSSTSFNIALNNCSAGINGIKYRIDAVTTALDAANAVVALDSSSTAKGAGVQLLDNASNVQALGTETTLVGVNGANSYTIPLRARYRQTEATVRGGTANSSMTFTMSYQ